jgi:hypothetical protein
VSVLDDAVRDSLAADDTDLARVVAEWTRAEELVGWGWRTYDRWRRS